MANTTKSPARQSSREKAQRAADEIINLFREPSRLPEALAPIFIHRRDDVPCRSWSWMNQLIVGIHGHNDARGFRQWNKVGRYVNKGERSFQIFVPVKRIFRDEETEEDHMIVSGFRPSPVFGYDQTDGDDLPLPDPKIAKFIEWLPLGEVARKWNITVTAYNGSKGQPLGRFSKRGNIAVGVKNLSTWCHELVHAADHRNGSLTECGQHWRSETVAELGGAVLLKVLGNDHEIDLGGCWDYIESYAGKEGIHTVTACQRVLNRTCNAISLILDTADQT